MGGGKERRQTNQMLQQQYGQEQQAYQEGRTRNVADLGKYSGRGDELYGTLRGHFGSLAGGDGGRGDGGGGGGGGPAAPSDFERFYQGSAGEGGGWDPNRLRSVQGDIRDVRAMAGDPEISRRMRGAGVFDEFARSGGYSESDKANIRTRATSGIPAMFGRMRDEAGRIANVQGGYGPGQVALMSRMGRDQARGISDASLNAELGISDAVRSGRMGAAEALSGAEGRLQSLRGDAFRGAYGMETGLESDIYGRRSGALDKLEQKRQSDAASGAANSRFAQQFAFQRQMAGLEGLQSLYGGTEGGYGRGLDYDLSNRGIGAGIQRGNIQQRMENNPSWQEQWAPIIGAGAGVAGAFF